MVTGILPLGTDFKVELAWLHTLVFSALERKILRANLSYLVSSGPVSDPHLTKHRGWCSAKDGLRMPSAFHTYGSMCVCLHPVREHTRTHINIHPE